MGDLTKRGYATVLCRSSPSTLAAKGDDIRNANLGAMPRVALVFASEDDCNEVALTVDQQVLIPVISAEALPKESFTSVCLSELTRQRAQVRDPECLKLSALECEDLFKNLLCQNYDVC